MLDESDTGLGIGGGATTVEAGIAAVQSLQLTAGMTAFTLTLNGVATTPSIPYTGAFATDALAIQSALNNLPYVINASGVVTVVQTGSNLFSITFGGGLTGTDVQLNAVLTAGVGVPTVTTNVRGGGAALELGNTVTTENGGVEAGVDVWGEQLILKGAGDAAFGDQGGLTVLASNTPMTQTLTLTGAPTGINLTYNGVTTAAPVSITGVAATDATAIAAALNGLSSVTSVNGVVTVSPGAAAGAFSVTFGGGLLGQDRPLSAAVASGTGTAFVTNANYGGPVDDLIVPTDNLWHGAVTLAANTTIDVNTANSISSRVVLDGPIDDAANPSVNGSSLTATGGGETDLAGDNTYRGTTYINQGVVTAENTQALAPAA